MILSLGLLTGCSKPTVFKSDNNDFLKKPALFETKHSSENHSSDQSNQSQETVLPDSYYIEDVPFVPQAPFAIWDELHKEACEEAASLIVHYYLTDNKLVSRELFDEELQKMVDWQVRNWGSHKDLTSQETANLVKGYFGYEARVSYDISISDIKKEIAKGNPVIVPAAGRELGNPYFRQPGPIYHMLVIRGYDDQKAEFITNDPGTKRGENYRYKYQVLYDAIHDWNGSPETITQGRKAMIIIH